MWAFLEINFLLLMYFMLLYYYFSSAEPSSLYSSSCQLQGQFHLNEMHKDGDVVLVGYLQFTSSLCFLTFLLPQSHNSLPAMGESREQKEGKIDLHACSLKYVLFFVFVFLDNCIYLI